MNAGAAFIVVVVVVVVVAQGGSGERKNVSINNKQRWLEEPQMPKCCRGWYLRPWFRRCIYVQHGSVGLIACMCLLGLLGLGFESWYCIIFINI